MGRYKNTIFTILLALLFVEVLIIFPRHLEKNQEGVIVTEKKDKDSDSEDEPEEEPSKIADQKMSGIHIVESQKGKRDWELSSEYAEESAQDKGSWRLRRVKVLYYNNDKVDFTVVGDKGSIDGKTKDMHIQGHVITTSSNNFVFKSDKVDYQAMHRKITSDSHIVVDGPRDEKGQGLHVEGKGLLVLVDESKMEILSDVKATKEFKPGKKFDIASEKVEFSTVNKQAHFKNSVVMHYEKAVLESPEATFLYSSGADLLSSVQLLGGVKVRDYDKQASSEKLNLDLITNQFTFTGKPKVIQNEDELGGERIIFLDGGKKVKVEGVKAHMESKE